MNTPASSIKFSLGSTPAAGPERPSQPTPPTAPSPAAASSSKTHVNDAIRDASRRAFRGALIAPSPDPRIKGIQDQEADDLIETIDLAIKRHRRSDVENWTKVVCKKIIKLTPRISAFASYLKQLSRINSLTEQTGATFCLSDVLHKLAFASDLQQRDASQFSTIIGGVLPDLFTSIVDNMPVSQDENRDDQLDPLKLLLRWWKSWDCLPSTAIEKLESIVDQSSTNGENAKPQWVLPTMLGEPGTPWYDLPAANMLRFIKPNSKAPIRTRDIRPLVFKSPGEPDPELLAAVEALLLDVKRDKDDTHTLEEGETVHFDRMGQRIYRDAEGKPSRRQDTYYGWSPEFCIKMTARKKKIREDRNRWSDSVEDDRRGRLEKRYGRLDRGDSRSRSRHRRGSSYRSRGSDYSRSRSSSRPRHRTHRRSSSHSRSRSRTRRQSHTTSGDRSSNQTPMTSGDVYPPYPNMNAQPFFNPNNPMFLPHPPPNWVGPWPPPPPPPPPPMSMPGMPFALPNGAPLPFPPPPPPPMPFQQGGGAPPFLPQIPAQHPQPFGSVGGNRQGQEQKDKREFRW